MKQHILLILLFACSFYAAGQCPASEANFLAGIGAPYNGPCVLDVGSELRINGISITWTSGTITFINSGGGNANVRIYNGGSLTVENGGAVVVDNGRLLVGLNPDDVTQTAATLTVNTGGTLTTTGTGDNEVYSFAQLRISGDVNLGGDLEINGGAVNVAGTGDLTIDRVGGEGDLILYNGGTINIDAGAQVSVQDDVLTIDDNTMADGGTINLNGTLVVGDDIAIANTDPASSLNSPSGIGTLDTGTGTFADANCGSYATGLYTFCNCTGGGGICNSVLPIELFSFEVFQHQDVVVLEWTTASELNNDYFTIQKISSDDVIQDIMTVKGSGTSQIKNSYHARDSRPKSGKNYYRLKQTDYDGATSTSEMKMVDFKDENPKLIVLPNPVEENTCEIELAGLRSNALFTVYVTSTTNTILKKVSMNSDSSGVLRGELDTDGLPDGIYLVKVAGNVAKVMIR